MYRFPFDGVLPPETRQDTVFERVAHPALQAALGGYNATVFAYGAGRCVCVTALVASECVLAGLNWLRWCTGLLGPP